MKRARLNLLLLVLVAALAGGAYFSSKKPEAKSSPLTALSSEAITRISIQHPQQAALQLEKRGSSWWLTAPVTAPCDPFEVATLLNLASASTQRSFKLSEVKPAELKLDPPQFTITLNDQTLAFGDVEPLEYRRYVQHGDTVTLIDDPAATSVDADYSDLLAKSLLPPEARLTAIKLPGLSLTRSADGKQWQADPAPAGLGADDISRLVEAWRQARSMWNAAMPTSEAVDAQAPQPIELTLEGGQTVQLLLISREPQLIIDRPDLKLRYTLSKADADTLLSLKPAAKTKS